MIKVLIVEDSLVARELMQYILGSEPDLHVVGTAKNGEEAIDLVNRLRPDVVTMDAVMPGMDGIEATRKIMETHPVPILIVSASYNPDEVEITFRAMDAGAVAVVEKPAGIGHPKHEKLAGELVETVRLISEIKVVRRWARRKASPEAAAVPVKAENGRADIPPFPGSQHAPRTTPQIEVVAIGASTGGPPVLQTILLGLPKSFPVPLLIVQHIAKGFLQGMLDWLHDTTGFAVQVAVQGEKPLAGCAYVAPDNLHLGVDMAGRITLSNGQPENGLRPSVSFLFRSVANSFGKHAAGVILTGMGKDGARELKFMRDAGAVTIAQDEQSSVVHGMPGEAIRIGGATYVLPQDKIAEKLNHLAKRM